MNQIENLEGNILGLWNEGKTPAEIANCLVNVAGVSRATVYRRLDTLGLRSATRTPVKWTTEADAKLKSLFESGVIYPEIASEMELPLSVILRRCRKIGLAVRGHKPPAVGEVFWGHGNGTSRGEQAEYWIRAGGKRNRSVPLRLYLWKHHVGAILPAHIIIFKDGNPRRCVVSNLSQVAAPRPGYNVLPPGTVTWWNNGTAGKYIIFFGGGQFMQLNHYLWEKHVGPIPPGHQVAYRDRNHRRCVLSNLFLTTQAENNRRQFSEEFKKSKAGKLRLERWREGVAKHYASWAGKERARRSGDLLRAYNQLNPPSDPIHNDAFVLNWLFPGPKHKETREFVKQNIPDVADLIEVKRTWIRLQRTIKEALK